MFFKEGMRVCRGRNCLICKVCYFNDFYVKNIVDVCFIVIYGERIYVFFDYIDEVGIR